MKMSEQKSRARGRVNWVHLVVAGSLVIPIASHPGPASSSPLPVFDVSRAAPPVERVIGRVSVKVCRVSTDSAAQAEATDRLQQKAAAMGATAIVGVTLKIETSPLASITHGFANPCRFEADAKGTAVVLANGAPS
jgi:uncharacterized protein YbjQ (UPF0145 family)